MSLPVNQGQFLVRPLETIEPRQFLLYTGPLALYNVVSDEQLEHFLTLSISVSILLDFDLQKRLAYVEYAKQLLDYYFLLRITLKTAEACQENIESNRASIQTTGISGLLVSKRKITTPKLHASLSEGIDTSCWTSLYDQHCF